MTNRRATKRRRSTGVFSWLLAAVLLAAFAGRAGAQGERQFTPEQSKAVTEALTLMTQSSAAQQEGKFDAAIESRERAQQVIEKAFGPDDALSALNLPLLAFLHWRKGDNERAEALYLRAIAVKEKLHGPEHPEVSNTLLTLAAVYNASEQFAKAEPVIRRALAIREKALGTERPEVAEALFYLAATYARRGDYGRVEPLLKRALAIQEKALGPEHPHVALTLNNLAHHYKERGDYAQAESFFLRTLALFEKLLGPDASEVATPLNNLATLYRQKGDYVRAEPLFKRGLAIAEKALGPESEEVAIALNSLALLYSDKGDDERALPLYRRALAIREKVLGPRHSSVAATLVSIAAIHNDRREYADAVALYERALKIAEQALGVEHPLYASILSNLAVSYAEQGDAERAGPPARRALEIREKVLGPEHADVAISLNTLAYLHFMRNEFEKEEPLYLRAVGIAEKAYGPDHPAVGTLLANLSTIYWGRGDAARALPILARISELRERNLALVLTTGSEEQKRLYMGTLADETDAYVSFHLRAAPKDAQSARLALTTVLRRKGRVLDAMTDQIGALRRRLNPEDRALLDRLSAARSALARLALGGADSAGRRAERDKLAAEVERLEEEVSARSAEFRAGARPVRLETVREALPAGTALVEFVAYRPYDPRTVAGRPRFGPRRYAAYVLPRAGEPLWAELGEAEVIDRGVDSWRRSLVNPSAREVKERARALDQLVMAPVRKLLGATRQLFLSPDGALNLIPFGALVDERGRYLVEDYSITYLTSGRDLLRTQPAAAASRQGPLVVANPSFDAGSSDAATSDAAAAGRLSRLGGANFSPLPGTKGEAAALGSILKGVSVLTGAEANEAALKRVGGPSVLHVATHGFFLPDRQPAAEDTARPAEARGLVVSRKSAEDTKVENPLLRSGLALAGANRGGGAGEDGVLTAYEAAALDLWGTRLVVLSACETGVGDVRAGEGVYGLRRALVLAGSESQVMSLWQVDDAATRDLMVEYYKRLQAGEGRTEALRAVQLEMLRRGGGQSQEGTERALRAPGEARRRLNRSHPFFWAAFIQSGDWRSMDGK